MKMWAKIGHILYDYGGKPGTYYPDLEPGNEFWNRVRVPGSGYKSLVDADAALVLTASFL